MTMENVAKGVTLCQTGMGHHLLDPAPPEGHAVRPGDPDGAEHALCGLVDLVAVLHVPVCVEKVHPGLHVCPE